MRIESVPSKLVNVNGDSCFASCMGMALTHFDMLGGLSLGDIVSQTSQPSEAVTPMHRALGWLASFGLQVEYIENLPGTERLFIESLERAGVNYTGLRPTTQTAIERVNRGDAIITQINYDGYTGQPYFALNHAVFLSSFPDGESVWLVDPADPRMAYGTDDLSDIWGPYPNLISIRKEASTIC
jgi:hypothetical protein